MNLSDIGTLAGLALLDSTSTGTLTIPAVMLLQPRVRFSRILGYLTTISLFYWGLGLALTTVGTRITASPGLRDALESRGRAPRGGGRPPGTPGGLPGPGGFLGLARGGGWRPKAPQGAPVRRPCIEGAGCVSG